MATSQTYTSIARLSGGNYHERVVDVTADGTYSTGGYALATADYQALIGGPNNRAIGDFYNFVAETNLGGYTVSLDRTNQKLVWLAAGAEATTTISSKVVRVRVVHNPVDFK